MINFRQLENLLSNTEDVLIEFNAVRAASSDDQWDEWNSGPLSKLLDALSDLEYTREQ
jgi:hypothetical protein